MFRNREHTTALRQLRSLRQFRSFTDRELDIIDELATGLSIEPGRTVCRQGQLRREVIIMTDGTVVARHDRTIEQLGPEQAFRDLTAIDRGVWDATVTTLERSEFLVFTRAEFAALKERVPRIARVLLVDASTRTPRAARIRPSEQARALRRVFDVEVAD